MKRLSFESPSEFSVVCVVLSLLLGVVDSSIGSTSTPQQAPATKSNDQPGVFSDIGEVGTMTPVNQVPSNVKSVELVNRSETSIDLEWRRVGNISTYRLKYDSNEININESTDPIRTVVSNLTAGTKYAFILFTVLENASSRGFNFQGVTVPKKVPDVELKNRSETSVDLEWGRVGNISTYRLIYDNNEININESTDPIRTVVSNLTAGTKYFFTLFTVFENVNSSGFKFEEVTVPKNVLVVNRRRRSETSIDLEWGRVGNISTYRLIYDNNEININESTDPIRTVVSNLTAGTKYVFTLFTVFENVDSAGLMFEEVTVPKKVLDVELKNRSETSVDLEWGRVDNISTYTLIYGNNEINITESTDPIRTVVSNLTAGTKYAFTLFTVFENVNSAGLMFEEVTVPRNTKTLRSAGQTETSITLEWEKVDGIHSYNVAFDEVELTVDASVVSHNISNLNSGKKYYFTFFTKFENISSSKLHLVAVTVPPPVDGVNVTERSLTSITLQWENANNNWKYQLEIDNCDSDCTAEPEISALGVVTHKVQPLKPGTKYTFRVITLFEHKSKPFEVVTVTVIDCSGVPWQITTTSVQATVVGEFTKATIKNITGSPIHSNETVSFSGLCPGATYNITLEYEAAKETLLQCEHELTLHPSNPVARCEYEASGYAIRVVWDQPDGVCTSAEVNVSGKHRTAECEKRYAIIPGFEPARTYRVSLDFLSGVVRSQAPFISDCGTDPRGVIAGSVLAVLIFIILVCVVLYIVFKRPDLIRRKKLSTRGSKLSMTRAKVISLSLFPCHFSELSLDENRGFREEYESLSAVGRKQSQDAAELQENAPRNRFTNVLPYDWNRVKLTTSDSFESTDYINASYMPGYKSSKEFIATQGPLPSTLNDFWRMIWEQQVKGIVMVTNCTELGRTKCEQYWPSDGQSRTFRDLIVTTVSEQQLHNWTLRKFSVKHKNTSEERTVRHFHFTAWPDHGVPQGTDILIQFRGLVREHIERDGGAAPTVVHCSAGVGRTGTLIALDALLQQLDKEQAIGINAFVHRMRLNRPYMVQTESQYIFLHQCILDSLPLTEKADEHIYEDAADTIYVNATALQDLH